VRKRPFTAHEAAHALAEVPDATLVTCDRPVSRAAAPLVRIELVRAAG